MSHSCIGIADRISSHGVVVLRYDDLRCANAALRRIRTELPAWMCHFANYKCWLELAQLPCFPLTSAFEGQILVSLVPCGYDKPLSLHSRYDMRDQIVRLTGFLAGAGDIKSSECILANSAIIIVKVEFYSLRAVGIATVQSSYWPFQVNYPAIF